MRYIFVFNRILLFFRLPEIVLYVASGASHSVLLLLVLLFHREYDT